MACQNYKYFALQDSSWCSCDHDLAHAQRYGTDASCAGVATGGPSCNMIYENTIVYPAATYTEISYLGYLKDSDNGQGALQLRQTIVELFTTDSYNCLITGYEIRPAASSATTYGLTDIEIEAVTNELVIHTTTSIKKMVYIRAFTNTG